MIYYLLFAALFVGRGTSEVLYKSGLASCGSTGEPVLLDLTSNDFSQSEVVGVSVDCLSQPPSSGVSNVVAAQILSTSIKGFGVIVDSSVIVPCSTSNPAYGFLIFFDEDFHDNSGDHTPKCLNPSAIPTETLPGLLFCLHTSPSNCWGSGVSMSMYRVDSYRGGLGTISSADGLTVVTPQGDDVYSSDPYTWTNNTQITSFLVWDGSCVSCGGDYAQPASAIASAFASYFPPHYITMTSLDSVAIVHSSLLTVADLPCSSFPTPIATLPGQLYFCGMMLGGPLSPSILQCGYTPPPTASAVSLGSPLHNQYSQRLRIRRVFGWGNGTHYDPCGVGWTVDHNIWSQGWNISGGYPVPQTIDDPHVDSAEYAMEPKIFTFSSLVSRNLTMYGNVTPDVSYNYMQSFFMYPGRLANVQLTVKKANLVLAYKNFTFNSTSAIAGKIFRPSVQFISLLPGELTFVFSLQSIYVANPFLGEFSVLPVEEDNCRWDHLSTNGTRFLASSNYTAGNNTLLLRRSLGRRSLGGDLVLALPGVGPLMLAHAVEKAVKKIAADLNALATMTKTSLATLDFFQQYTTQVALTKPLIVSFSDQIEQVEVYQSLSNRDSDMLYSVASAWVPGQLVKLNNTYFTVTTGPPLLTLTPTQVCAIYGNGTKVSAPDDFGAAAVCNGGEALTDETTCLEVACSTGDVATITATCDFFQTDITDQTLVTDITDAEIVSHFTGHLLGSISDIITNFSVSLGPYASFGSVSGALDDLTKFADDLLHPFTLSSFKSFGLIILYVVLFVAAIMGVMFVLKLMREHQPNGVSPARA